MRVNGQDVERFFQKVDMSGPKVLDTPCWIWKAAKNRDAYGEFWLNDGLIRAHLFTFELTFGPMPEGKLAMHLCDNPSCVNPAHLAVGTDKENVMDSLLKGRQKDKSRRYSPELSETIRREFADGVDRKDLCAKYGMCQRTLRLILLNRRQKDVMSHEEWTRQMHAKKAETRRRKKAALIGEANTEEDSAK